MALDAIGNLTSRQVNDDPVQHYDYTNPQPGCSYYSHAQPRAVRKVGGTVFCYDPNGNMSKRAGSTISYTSYNLPNVINAGTGYSSTLSYGAFRNRFKQIAVTPTETETTIYVAGLFEKVTRTSSGTEYRHLIQSGRGTAAIYTRSSGGSGSTAYVHTDHLGSPELITGSSGTVLVRPSFSAYGERRDGNDWDGPPGAGDLATIANLTRRGFTGHEHLDAVNLIHMNGRVYEPIAGRFLSRDPFIDGFASSQGMNGYAYVHNNPLTLTDPSGFCGDVTDPCPRIDGGGRIAEPIFNPGVHNERARARHPARWQGRPNASTRGDPLRLEGGTGLAYGVDATNRAQRRAALRKLKSVEEIIKYLRELYPIRGDDLRHSYVFTDSLCHATEAHCDEQRAIDIEFGQPVPPPGRQLTVDVWQIRAGFSAEKSFPVGNVDVVSWRTLGAHANLTWDNSILESGGHFLQRGVVFRQIFWHGDRLMLRTIGIGNNLSDDIAEFNQKFGPLVFRWHNFWVRWQLHRGVQ